LILSTAGSKGYRDAIRAGWLSDLANAKNSIGFKYKFVLGHNKNMVESRETHKMLGDEILQYDDILILPFVDDYWNLTVKVSLMFKWPSVSKECKLIVKADEDVYIRADKFTSMIRSLPDVPLYGGHVYDRVNRISAVSRDKSNRHSFTREEFPNDAFEPYAGGPVYFMSSTVAKKVPYKLVEVPRSAFFSDYVPDTFLVQPQSPLYKLEDAFMGTQICKMDRESVTLWHIENFLTVPSEADKSSMIVHNIKDPTAVRRGKAVFG
jgi:hypothetical protein